MNEQIAAIKTAIERVNMHQGWESRTNGILNPGWIELAVCPFSLEIPNETRCGAAILKDFKDTDVVGKCTLCPALEEDPASKVIRPWPEYAPSFTCWSPFCGDGLVLDLDEKKLDRMREAMAIDGIMATRDFGWSCVGPEDPTNGKRLMPWKWGWAWNEEYWSRLDRRLAQWCNRDGTYVVSILDACSFYLGDSFETNPLKALLGLRPQDIFRPVPARDRLFDYARELVKRTRKFMPRIILQTRNEGEQLTTPENLYDYDNDLIAVLKAEGVPVENIMIGYYDSSLCLRTLMPETWTDPRDGQVYHGTALLGRGLADAHNIGSPEGLGPYDPNSFERVWAIKWGSFPSCDGPDKGHAAAGLGWFWLHNHENDRPTAPQAVGILQTMKKFGRWAFEWWSSTAFQKGDLPDLNDAIELGHAERIAMVEGSR